MLRNVSYIVSAPITFSIICFVHNRALPGEYFQRNSHHPIFAHRRVYQTINGLNSSQQQRMYFCHGTFKIVKMYIRFSSCILRCAIVVRWHWLFNSVIHIFLEVMNVNLCTRYQRKNFLWRYIWFNHRKENVNT